MSDMANSITKYLLTFEEAKVAGIAGDFQKAKQKFTECINIDDKSTEAFILRATAHERLKEYELAMSDIYKAIALDQTNAVAYETKGLIEWCMGDLQSALVDYSKSILMDPNNSIAFLNRGQVKRDTSDLDGAIEDFNKAIELDQNNTIAQQCLDLCNIYKESPELYKMVIEKDT